MPSSANSFLNLSHEVMNKLTTSTFGNLLIGTLGLLAQDTPSYPNDKWTDAIPLSGTSFSVASSTGGSTLDYPENFTLPPLIRRAPSIINYTGSPGSLWWQWTAPEFEGLKSLRIEVSNPPPTARWFPNRELPRAIVYPRNPEGLTLPKSISDAVITEQIPSHESSMVLRVQPLY